MLSISLENAKKNLKKDPLDLDSNLEIGFHYLKEKKYKEALKHFKISLDLSPRASTEILIKFEEHILENLQDINARLALVDFLVLIGDIDLAILELEELVDLSYKCSAIYNKFGRLYLKIGNIDAAISLLEKAIESNNVEDDLLESLANAYLEKNRYLDAIKTYEKLILHKPNNKRVLRSLGELYTRIKDYEKASYCYFKMLSDDPEVINEVIEKLESLARLEPNNTTIHEHLAEVYLKSIKPSKAVLELSTVLKIDPEKISNVVTILKKLLHTYPDEPEGMFLYSQCLIKKGEYSEATEVLNKLESINSSYKEKCAALYEKIIEIYPKQSLARKYLADYLFSKGKIKEAMLQYLEVIRIDPSEIPFVSQKCREILKINPQMKEPCLVLAESFLINQDYRKAIALAEELVSKNKDVFEAYRILAQAYIKIDLLSRAKEALKNALMLNPFDIELQAKFKEVSEKELEREISTIKTKLQQDPWRIGLNLDLARLLYKKGALESSARAIQNAFKDTSKLISCHKLMGIIFKEQGRFDLALAQFEKIMELKPDIDAEKIALSQAASCKEAMGQISEAIELYEKVFTMDVDYDGISFRIKYLKNANPFYVRNKILAAYVDLEQGNLKAIWGRDGRKHKDVFDEDLMSLTFGQGQNNSGFEKFLKEKVKESEEDFKLACQLDSTLLAAQNNLAVVYLKNGDFKNAESILSSLLVEDATNPVFLNNLAVMFILKSDFENAKKYLLSSLKYDKEFNIAIFNFIQLLLRDGNIKLSMDYYKKISNCDPLYELLQRKFYYIDFLKERDNL